MAWIVDDLVDGCSDVKPEYKPDFEHIRCECGGVIGMYELGVYSCTDCGKRFQLFEIDYDRVMVNTKTGWIFPVKDKEVCTC